MGFVGRTLCRMGMRAWNTLFAAAVELTTMLLEFLQLPAPKTIPATPDPVCELALRKLSSLHRVFQELPTFMFGVVCDVILRGGRYAFALYSEVGLKVLDLAIQTLNGEGHIFDIIAQILTKLATKLDPDAFLAMMSGEGGVSADVIDKADAAPAAPAKTSGKTAFLEGSASVGATTGVFGLPKEITNLVIDVVKPVVIGLFRYQELQGAIAGAFVLTTGLKATMSSPNDKKKDPKKKADPKKAKASLLEVGAARSRSRSRSRSRALSRSGASSVWSTGQMGSFEEMGFGVGGPGPVEESYPYQMMIHSRMSHSGVNGAGVGTLTDKLAMCVKRTYALKKQSISSSADIKRINSAMQVCRSCTTADEKSEMDVKCLTKKSGPAAMFNWPDTDPKCSGCSGDACENLCDIMQGTVMTEVKKSRCASSLVKNAHELKKQADKSLAAATKDKKDVASAKLNAATAETNLKNAKTKDVEKEKKRCRETQATKSECTLLKDCDWTPFQGTHTVKLDIVDSTKKLAFSESEQTVELVMLTTAAGGTYVNTNTPNPKHTSHGTSGPHKGVQWSSSGGLAIATLPSDHIRFWLEQGDAQAAACWEAAGYEIVVDMVLDPGCGEEDGSPDMINDEEFSMEALDKCVDLDVQIGDIFTNMMSPDGVMKKMGRTLGMGGTVSNVKKANMDAQGLGKSTDGKMDKFMCFLKSKLGGPEESGVDVTLSLRKQLKREVAITARFCNLDSLNYDDLVDFSNMAILTNKHKTDGELLGGLKSWNELLKKRRPFFGMFEKTQYDQTISRTNFGEYGFSVELQFSLFSEPDETGEDTPPPGSSFLSSLLGRAWGLVKTARRLKKRADDTKAYNPVMEMLDSLMKMNIQLALTRNKYGFVDFVIDITSFHNNEMTKSLARVRYGLNAKQDIPDYAFHLFSVYHTNYNGTAKTLTRKTIIMGKPIDAWNSDVKANIGTDRAQQDVIAKMSLSIAVKIMLAALEHTQDHELEGGDKCKKMQKRNDKKQKARDSKKTAEEDKKKRDEWQEKHKNDLALCASFPNPNTKFKERCTNLEKDKKDLEDKFTASQTTADDHKTEYQNQFEKDELEKRYKEIERRTAGKCNTNVGKAANKPDCDKLQEANDKFEEKKKEVEEQEKTDEQKRLDAVEGGLKTNTANIRKADLKAQADVTDQEDRLKKLQDEQRVQSDKLKAEADKLKAEADKVNKLKAEADKLKADLKTDKADRDAAQAEQRVQSDKLKAEAIEVNKKLEALEKDKEARDAAQAASPK